MKTIIVTGSTGGLGSALVEEIYKLGYQQMICMYRNKDKFEKLFKGKYEKIIGYYTKNSEDDQEGLQDIIGNDSEEVIVFLTAFDILPIKKIGTYSREEISQMIDGNVKDNVFVINDIVNLCKKYAIPLRIVNIDSGAADHALQGWGQYSAAKSYLNAFLGTLALENPEYKIVCVDPGVIDTDMQRKIRETDKNIFDRVDEFIDYKNDKRLCKAGDVARLLTDRYLVRWDAGSFREKLPK